MTDFNELFNPKGAVPREQKVVNEFRPDPKSKQAQGGVYQAIIRFVVNPANPAKCIMSKLTAWVENPLTQAGMYVDDPRSVGSQESPVNKMYWSLVNTKKANLEDLAKKCLSTKNNYASLVQVIQDPQHPENVGKILVWRFGKKVYEKLENEQNPPMEGMTAYNPFDPINGRYFSMKVTIQGGYPNYDQCQFIDYKGTNGETSGIWFDNPTTGRKEICTANSDKQVFFDYLVQNSPDLSKYDYQPWTPAVQEHVDTVLRLIGTYVTTGSYGQNMATAQPTSMSNPAPAPATPAVPTMGGISFGGTPTPNAAPAAPLIGIPNLNTPVAPSISATPAVPNITGIEIPDVASALPNIEPVGAPAPAPTFGDLSSVLANM